MKANVKRFYTRAGETINRYELKIFQYNNTPSFEHKQIPIFCNSEEQLVIKSEYRDFEVIFTKKHKIFSDNYVDNINIYKRDWTFSTSENGLYISMYTFRSKKIAINRMKKELAKYLSKNSWMYNFNIDRIFEQIKL